MTYMLRGLVLAVALLIGVSTPLAGQQDAVLDHPLSDYGWVIGHGPGIDQAIADWHQEVVGRAASIRAIGHVRWRAGRQFTRWTEELGSPLTLRLLLEHSWPRGPVPPPPSPPGTDQIDVATVRWLHADVRDWTISSEVTDVTLPGDGRDLCIFHTQAGKWPVYLDGGVQGEGNPWVFANIGGQWYGATFEWLRPGQQCKPVITRENIGPHTKQPPLSSWVPQPGELVGFMMSTPARSALRTSNERSNVVLVPWP